MDSYWRAVSLLSGDVARLPLCPFRREGKRKIEDDTHPAYTLMQYEFSPEVTALAGKRTLTLHALTEGNGYAYIVRRGDGRPLELWPLSPMKTYPVRENQRLWYVTEFGNNDGKQQRRLPSEDVFHLQGLSFDGLVGYSAVAKMRETLGLGLAQENYGSIYFRNNARPSVVLKHPGRLKAEAKQNLRESWERLHSGLENAHRTAVLEEGMEAQLLSINARDSQLIESKAFSRTAIANFFGIPPHKLGDSARTSYNSLEEENDSYIEDGGGLGFWLPAWEVECWRKLLSEQEKADHSHLFKFKTRHLRRGNRAVRTTYLQAMVLNGILSPDEAREEEGYDPREDGLGGEYYQPINVQIAGEEPEPAPSPPAAADGKEGEKPPANPPAPAPTPPAKGKKKGKRTIDPTLLDSHRDILRDSIGRMLRRIAHHAERAAHQPGTFLAWLDTIQAEHGGVIREAVGPGSRALAALYGETAAANGLADSLVRDTRAALLDLAGEVSAKDLLPRVKSWAGSWEPEQTAKLVSEYTSRAVDEPERSVEDALAILEQIPERRPGQILPPFPVMVVTPYILTAEKLRDLWAAKKVDKAKVRIRELIATQDWIDKEELRAALQDMDFHGDSLNVEGVPHDRPTVVLCKDELYIYDGHHRLTARHLLRVAKSKVYLVEM